MKIIFLTLSLLSFSVMSSPQDPDSVVLNSGFDISLSNSINKSFAQELGLKKVVYGDWGLWSTVGELGCGGWSPNERDINLGVEFTQYQYCDAEQERERKVSHYYNDGSVRVKTETQKKIVPDEIDNAQSATGTKNYILYETETYSPWYTQGSKYACGFYLPDKNTVENGTSFQQKQKCLNDYYRHKYTYNHWANGSRTLKNSITQRKTDDSFYYRMATGTMVVSVPWTVGRWGSCSASCYKFESGWKSGKQTRPVSCSATSCIGDKPATQQTCRVYCSASDGGR